MSIWPFANRAKQPAPQQPATSTPADSPSSEKNPAAASPELKRRLSKRRSLQPTTQRRNSARRKPRRALENADATVANDDNSHNAMDVDPARARHRPRAVTKGSDGAENVTALPGSKALRTSPHLRPVTQDTADIPYNWNKPSTSHTSLPKAAMANNTQQRRTKLQRNQSRNKRAAYDSPLARRPSNKKRRNDPIREEEIRAMSKPIDVPQRGATDGLLRRESRQSRGPLNRNFERPVSVVSLPFEDSIHSSMSGDVEQRNYRLSVMDILSPRPAIRFRDPTKQVYQSDTAAVNLVRKSSKLEKRPSEKAVPRWKPSEEEEKARERARIDSLADELDSTDLRDILERDRKRKARRQDRDAERLKRKLERKAEKQRMKEWLSQQEGESEMEKPAHDDLGIETGPVKERELEDIEEPDFAMDDVQYHESSEITEANPFDDKQALSPEDIHPAFRTQEMVHPAFRKAEVLPASRKPIHERPAVTASPKLRSRANTHESAARDIPTPMSEVETPMETPALNTAQAISYTSARPITPLTPVTSAIYHGNRRKASKILGADVAGGSYTVSNTVLDEAARPKDAPMPEAPVAKQEAPVRPEPEPQSATSVKKGGFLASLFRGRRRSTSATPRNVQTPEAASFSNTSREQMHQTPPSHLVHQPSSATKKSGPLLRTTSIFREDLPESPLSPPDSRVQSPVEIGAVRTRGMSSRQKQRIPSTILTEGSSRVGSPEGDAMPASPMSGRASKLMSQSLASVDSEASWLSGRPPRAGSAARKHGSLGGGSLGRKEDFSGSFEELGIPEDEYFRRMNSPSRRGQDPSNLSLAIAESQHGSNSALHGVAQEQDENDLPLQQQDQVVSRTGASRQPTVIHHDGRHKSSEGLLNRYLSSEVLPEGSSGVITHDDDEERNLDEERTPEAEYPTPEETPRSSEEISTPVQRATSVNFGKGHARNISAGSAKLLDITRSRSQASTPNPPASPLPPVTPQKTQESLLKSNAPGAVAED